MDYVRQYIALVNGIKLVTIFGLIALDWALGVFEAIISKKFEWNKLADFLDTKVLKLVGGYFFVGVFAFAEPAISTLAITATWGIIEATLIADCINHFKEIGIVIKKK